jgi:tRNA-specific 2-thiouridylase
MKRVILGMSGGIDSSLSALLLQKQGYEVVGATMSFWDGNAQDTDWPHHGCFGPHEKENIADAAKVCAGLGIPHFVVDLRKEFKESVLDYFCGAYASGKTPNPCVRCNARIKFGAFLAGLARLGIEADFFATGHYARKAFSEDSGRWQILKAADPLKDQSYFLSYLSQEQIARTLFPLGELTKAEVKRLAPELNLGFLQDREESQDFLDPVVYPRLFPQDSFREGEIIDFTGKVIGKHHGLMYYTIGQRKHLGISGMPEPYYVVGIDAAQNHVVVGPQQLLYKDRLVAEDINWIAIPGLEGETRVETKIRLAHAAAPCVLKPLSANSAEVVFDEPQLSITPGQVAAFYMGDILLGGGIIA